MRINNADTLNGLNASETPRNSERLTSKSCGGKLMRLYLPYERYAYGVAFGDEAIHI